MHLLFHYVVLSYSLPLNNESPPYLPAFSNPGYHVIVYQSLYHMLENQTLLNFYIYVVIVRSVFFSLLDHNPL